MPAPVSFTARLSPSTARFHGVSSWLAPLALVTGNLLAFVHNALTYSSESGAALRRHLSVDTSLVPEVLVFPQQRRRGMDGGGGIGACGCTVSAVGCVNA